MIDQHASNRLAHAALFSIPNVVYINVVLFILPKKGNYIYIFNNLQGKINLISVIKTKDVMLLFSIY